MSTAPAGVKGTTMRIGFDGNTWLNASEGNSRRIANRRDTGKPLDGKVRAAIMADLSRIVSIEDLRQLARRRLPRAIFDFFDGGAEDEVTLRENRAAFERVRLLPKVLVNVAAVDMKTQLLGREATLPLAIAPTGGISAGRHGAELSLARAAKAFGVPFTLATPSAFTIERVAEEIGGRLWFQLYAVREHQFREKLIARAAAAGYEAMLVTVDLPVSGKRERDPRNGFVTPYNPNWRNSRDVIFKPAWLLEILRFGLPGMANFEGYKFASYGKTDIATAVGRPSVPRHWAATAWWSPTTVGGNSMAPLPRWTHCPMSLALSGAGLRCCSTAACAAASTSSKRARWARTAC